MDNSKGLMPLIFASHGTPLMSITDCDSTAWFRKVGREIVANVKGIVIINSHWVELDDKIRVATNSDPHVDLTPLVPREKYDHFKPNISRDLGLRVISLLKAAGFPDVEESTTAEWVDAPTTPSLHMFPNDMPPATTVSINARYDPVFHVRMGQALRSLRKEGILLIASGSIVHNIFRGNHLPILLRRDNLQKGSQPAKFALDFEKSIDDIITSNTGAELAAALVRITQSPRYLEAHPSNDHFYPLLVLAGALYDDEEVYGRSMAKTYEMKNIVNVQYMWGDFGRKPMVAGVA
ncbi:hypothetical protein AYO21_07088 [Fonsecaea monophora]|uniref:Extradiol ring-cleavage dioxygenase class III enzyme subunit B domain-containing protein n=1 Tax=Fonsecaea monophora TaxID=254056 RepID=A0A177F359_9EURO|nr:hypothetical protein AYO21_07088 [Fonsecaea monophora]KAH0841495.1 aromatic ring-opening dioxygenase family protein [Fonsecaea pedrosoi]OAG38735.1 hypothetical protein AYO21_07088 [Fonsecaea monophora]